MPMIGYVSATEPEPRLTVQVLDHRGTAVPIEAVIDTGFTGYMTLPIDVVHSLRLEQTTDRRMRLADGRVRRLPTYSARVIWHGNPITVSTPAIPGKPLIGMSLLWNSDVAMAVQENGRVVINEPPQS